MRGRKKIYNTALNKKERHRVSDAIYRMKREGYMIPEDFDYSAIYPARSYAEIKKQVANTEGVEYSGVRYGSRGKKYEKPGVTSGKVAYERQQAQREYEQAVKKEKSKLKKKGLYYTDKQLQKMKATLSPEEFKKKTAGKIKDEDFPSYDIFNVEPSYITNSYSPSDTATEEGQRKLNEQYTKNLKESTNRLKRLSKNPLSKVSQGIHQTYENLLSSFNKSFNNTEVRKLVMGKVREMGPYGLKKFYDANKDNFDFEDFFGYNMQLAFSISNIFTALGIDLNTTLSDGRTLQEYADDASMGDLL